MDSFRFSLVSKGALYSKGKFLCLACKEPLGNLPEDLIASLAKGGWDAHRTPCKCGASIITTPHFENVTLSEMT